MYKRQVLDRNKETGSVGEPVYLDVVTALNQAGRGDIRVVGGRYGLSSKDTTPGQIIAVYDNLKQETPKNNFTIGINDDVTYTSLDYKEIDVYKRQVLVRLDGKVFEADLDGQNQLPADVETFILTVLKDYAYLL